MNGPTDCLKISIVHLQTCVPFLCPLGEPEMEVLLMYVIKKIDGVWWIMLLVSNWIYCTFVPNIQLRGQISLKWQSIETPTVSPKLSMPVCWPISRNLIVQVSMWSDPPKLHNLSTTGARVLKNLAGVDGWMNYNVVASIINVDLDKPFLSGYCRFDAE